MHPIRTIVQQNKSGLNAGVYSCCSANPFVVEAVMTKTLERGGFALIEATSNQVNQFGGYTGMTPAAFRDFVYGAAERNGLDRSRVILGGDHLGPLVWSREPEREAMAKASDMVSAYVSAGYTKIHLDTSMRLGDDPPDSPLLDETIARRGAVLCRIAEEAYAKVLKDNPDAEPPVYVVGSEVPVPGGAEHAEGEDTVTKAKDFLRTVDTYRRTFTDFGLEEAFGRVVGVVVQLGVEFGASALDEYDREAARDLTEALKLVEGIAFEAHSTDFQTPENLRRMVEDGAAILKVGPAFTFACREAMLALDMIERELYGDGGQSGFRRALEEAMLSRPEYWQKYYEGGREETRLMRMFSFYDRSRYYMPEPSVQDAIKRLMANLENTRVPLGVLSQYMPAQYMKVREGRLNNKPRDLVLDKIGDAAEAYLYAIGAD